MYGNFCADPCPQCGAHQLPPLTPKGSVASARRCQACGYVQELSPATGQPVPDASPRLGEGE